MRLPCHIVCLFLAAPLHSVLALPGQGIRPRQDGNDFAGASTLTSVSDKKQQQSLTETSNTSNQAKLTTSVAAPTSTELTGPSSVTGISSATSSAASPSSSGMHSATDHSKAAADIVLTAWIYPGHGLPLEPKVTPAVAIAGVVLIVSGALYALIGIRNSWVHVAFSAAFGAALAVIVLIEYLMNPPVTDAVQGAFLVVAVVTSLLIGSLAKLVFADMTQGLGCLLGGFCIAMWFLVLKPGGLIPQKAARGIFIACLIAACYGLSFIRYTRLHSLIVCISFAGATATVLGIDCFSRAGLKEFWLYLWGLNENAFPLSTNSYPITRGIRVEIAGIVIFSLFGIASQMKLWKVVRERRAQKDAQRRAQDQERDRIDTEMGEKNLNELNRDKAQWEVLYDDKPSEGTTLEILDSGIGSAAPSMHKATTVSLQEIGRSESDRSIETQQTATLGRETDAQLLPSPPSLGSDEIQQIDSHGRPVTMAVPQLPSHPKQTYSAEETHLPEDLPEEPCVSSLPEAPAAPIAVPLPFVIPSANSSRSDAEVLSSVASIHDELEKDQLPAADVESLRDTEILSDEAVVIPHFDDDKASSIAATLDDLNEQVASLPALSRVGTPFSALLNDDVENRGLNGRAHEASDAAAQNSENHQVSNIETWDAVIETRELVRKSMEPDERPEDRLQSRPSTVPDDERASDNEAPSQQSTNRSEITHSAGGSLKDHLPDNKISKVAQAYRTNEWAKYLSLADQPELEPIPEPSSPGVKVDVGALTETPTSAGGVTPQPESREAKLARHSKDGSQASSSVKPGKTPLTARSSSDGYVPYVEITQAADRRHSRRPAPIPTTLPVETLLGQRKDMVRSKIHTTSDTSSIREQLSRKDPDEMSLRERKMLLEQERQQGLAQHKHTLQMQHQLQQQRQMQSRAGNYAPRGHKPHNFDSHQPVRDRAVDRGKEMETWGHWRQSLQQSTEPTQVVAADERRRGAMISERNQAKAWQLKRQMDDKERESRFGERMRTVDWQNAHREQMRRIQAAANKHVNM
ncbi:hypothetical protein HDK77DRAFT_385520 [Phyllosticta capitalensis]